MTFNAAEAAAFETILYWVGVPNVSGDRPTDDQARQAFQLLGDSVFKATGVGCRPEDIRVAVEHTAERLKLVPSTSTGIVTWGSGEQPDLDALAEAVHEASSCRAHIYPIDTGSNDYAVV